MKKKTKYFILYIIFINTYLYAQTYNKGTLVVDDDTILSTEADFINSDDGTFLNDGITYIYKNFQNDGIVSHSTSSEGYTRFQGIDNQLINGLEISEFKHVLFYNIGDNKLFQLEGQIKINGISDFNKGIVDNRNFGGNVLFTKGSSHVNTWNGSFVDGKVEKLGDESFVFPIGHKNLYRFASISAPNNSSSLFDGIYFYENSNPLKSHAQKEETIEFINDKEYWIVNKQGNSDVILTLTWDEVTTPSNIYNSQIENMIIVGYDDSKNQWINLGGVVDIFNKKISTPVELKIYGFFTLAKAYDKIEDCIKIYNVITPITQDGNHDYLEIECIEKFPDNSIEIFNRWGIEVFSTKGYGVNGNYFNGYSQGRATIDKSSLLPTGTYFYIFKYVAVESGIKINRRKIGYLYLNGE